MSCKRERHVLMCALTCHRASRREIRSATPYWVVLAHGFVIPFDGFLYCISYL